MSRCLDPTQLSTSSACQAWQCLGGLARSLVNRVALGSLLIRLLAPSLSFLLPTRNLPINPPESYFIGNNYQESSSSLHHVVIFPPFIHSRIILSFPYARSSVASSTPLKAPFAFILTMSNLDRSLDEILSARPARGNKRGGEKSAPGGIRKRPQRAAAAKASAAVAASGPKSTSSGSEQGSKIIVSNLVKASIRLENADSNEA
jgi:hypothetical protein